MIGKISILIPIYNVSKYIHQCVDSVVNQTYLDWELILVDDGSPDDCPQICDEYTSKDARIKTVHKQNGGLASARNAGLNVASGEWIMMLDGDDWLDLITLEKCAKAVKETGADYIRFGMAYEYDGYSKDVLFPNSSEKDLLLNNMLSRRVPLSVVGGLYRKSLFNMLSPVFTNGLNFGEDYSVSSRLLYVSNHISIINEPFYHYRILSTGYVGNVKWKDFEQLVCCERINYDFFKNMDNGKYLHALKQGRASVKAYGYGLLLSNFRDYKKYFDYVNNLYKNDCSLDDANNDTTLLFFIMQTKLSMYLLRFIWNIRVYAANFIKKHILCHFGFLITKIQKI